MSCGILLLNMGGPNRLDEVELFLRNMFADPRILPMHPLLRRMIGRRIVRKRLHEAQANYRQLGGKSPLSDITQSLAKQIEVHADMPVRAAMRYVPPFVDAALDVMAQEGVETIVAFPMYPHYSTTTIGSSMDDLEAQLSRRASAPSLRVVEPYFDDEAYGRIVAARIREAIEGVDPGEYDLIFSAHGLPMRIVEAGDPYPDQIASSVRMIERLLVEEGVVFGSVRLAYQSKVGNAQWLSPDLADVLRHPDRLKVLVVPLAFTIDNSETLYELDVEHRAIAEKIGYDDYRVAACPNDGEDFARFVADKVRDACR